MSEFISDFGKENFIIIIVVVGVIILALIVIVLIEKFQIKSKMKKQIKRQISNINMAVNNVPRSGFNNVRNNNISSDRSEPVITQNNYNDVSAGEVFSYDNSNSVNINSNMSANTNTNTYTYNFILILQVLLLPRQLLKLCCLKMQLFLQLMRQAAVLCHLLPLLHVRDLLSLHVSCLQS